MEESAYWKKKIALASMTDDPKDILRKDKKIVRKLKEENAKLKESMRKLERNNSNMVKLLEVMEERVRKLTEDVKKCYVYSYEQGGWVEKGSMDRTKVEIEGTEPPHLSVDSINNQLSEILRMIERYKMKA